MNKFEEKQIALDLLKRAYSSAEDVLQWEYMDYHDADDTNERFYFTIPEDSEKKEKYDVAVKILQKLENLI